MLSITIPASKSEYWDEKNEEFIYRENGKEQTLELEHSLVSLSKWESKWHKSFLHCLEKDKLTFDEIIYYVKCMTLNRNVDDKVYKCLTKENIKDINDYINNPMTATTINEPKSGTKGREIITSELIYYWMISSSIPFECEKWHLNRLLTLIRVCNVKNQPAKKMSSREIMSRNRALNEARKKQLNSKG